MVNSAYIFGILVWVIPGLASLLMLVTAWRTSPARSAGWHEAPAALLAVISASLGAFAYLSHVAGVNSSRALVGATIAILASAFALGVYFAIGRFSRRLLFAVLAWAGTLLPLYVYAFWACLAVAAHTQCPPGAYECPI